METERPLTRLRLTHASMGGICSSVSEAVDIKKQAQAFSSAIRDAEQNRKYQELIHDKEQARLDKRAQNDKEAKRVLKEQREENARDALISDVEGPRTGRKASRDHDPPKSSRRPSADVNSRGSSNTHDYNSSVASKKANPVHRGDDNGPRSHRNRHDEEHAPRSHKNRRASVGFDGDDGTSRYASPQLHQDSEEGRRRSADDFASSKHSTHHSKHKSDKHKHVVTSSTTRGTVISTRKGVPEKLHRSNTATLNGSGDSKDEDSHHDGRFVRKASSFTLQSNNGNSKGGLLGALGMDVSFRRGTVHKKVTGNDLAWLRQMDTQFDNERDSHKSENLKQLDREIHKATAGFFHSM